jgi:hypothetical protein
MIVTVRKRAAVAGAALLFAVALVLPLAAQHEPVDLDAIYKIKEEGFQRSQVMDVLSYLTDVHGPRLTNSPNYRKAADWTIGKMKEWGLANPRTEKWIDDFGRGWSNDRFYAMAVSPQAFPLIAYPLAWTAGTNGPVTAEAVLAVINTEADIEKFRGKLKGKFVLTQEPPEVLAWFDAPGRRYTEQELDDMAKQPEPAPQPGRQQAGQFGPGGPGGPGQPNFQAMQAFNRKRADFFREEGVAGLLQPGRGRGDHGSVLVGGGGSRNLKDPVTPPTVAVVTEHYGRIARMLKKNVPVTLEMDIKNTFYDQDLTMFNIIAEIPGTDKADEIVMLGGHFDSWHGGTGAVDNAAGTAAMMEAMRILKTTGLRLRRTVRIGLWGGEEQGLIGSRQYVRQQFGDPATMKLLPGHAKLSGYFNIDNGTGALRGVYLQGNEAIAPVFSAWMEPFRNLGMTTLSIRNTGGTDHLAFDAVGLPGFQFIQDPVEYSTLSHHSNLDVYERIQPADMMKNAVIVASFVYHTANREQLLPRKPLPKPRPPQGPPM